jgi:hypothetical protein
MPLLGTRFISIKNLKLFVIEKQINFYLIEFLSYCNTKIIQKLITLTT